MHNVIFIVIDIIVFLILNLGLNIHWGIAFFASTAITWVGFYLFYYLSGYPGYAKL